MYSTGVVLAVVSACVQPFKYLQQYKALYSNVWGHGYCGVTPLATILQHVKGACCKNLVTK